jgi:DNA replication and repair protein RecF
MLSIQKIIITQFKNYETGRFDFDSNVVGICGKNGIGKTNLLDAIYYCCFTKSYFSGNENMIIENGKDGFRIEGYFSNNETPSKIICINKSNAKKEFSLNDVPYEKLTQHIGLLPCVMIAPDDIELINGASELRRKFMDTVLCQLDKDYMQSLIHYNKILLQRNSYLKNDFNAKQFDYTLLDIFDEQLVIHGNIIYAKRKIFTNELTQLVQSFYQKISEAEEAIALVYESNLNDQSLTDLLKQNRERDRMLQRTSKGIHRDDLQFSMHQLQFKTIASQGQKKSLLFAMKLAEYEIIKSTKGFSPILLLDDFFEKLDENRMNNLLKMVCIENQGQVIITDTHKSRLLAVFEKMQIKGQIIEL